MVCKMVKKGVIGAALTAGALYLAFGTHAPSYVRTAFHKVRHTAKDSVPIQFDIERARDEIAAPGAGDRQQQGRAGPRRGRRRGPPAPDRHDPRQPRQREEGDGGAA